MGSGTRPGRICAGENVDVVAAENLIAARVGPSPPGFNLGQCLVWTPARRAVPENDGDLVETERCEDPRELAFGCGFVEGLARRRGPRGREGLQGGLMDFAPFACTGPLLALGILVQERVDIVHQSGDPVGVTAGTLRLRKGLAHLLLTRSALHRAVDPVEPAGQGRLSPGLRERVDSVYQQRRGPVHAEVYGLLQGVDGPVDDPQVLPLRKNRRKVLGEDACIRTTWDGQERYLHNGCLRPN